MHPAVSLFLPHFALGQLFHNACQPARIMSLLQKLHRERRQLTVHITSLYALQPLMPGRQSVQQGDCHLGIQDLARWQFCRQTQSPSAVARATRVSATGPCPCPRLTMCKRSPGFMPCFSPNLCTQATQLKGSQPLCENHDTG